VAELGPEAVIVQARTFERLVTGQTRETVGPGPDDDPVEHYLGVLADKTGALIATAGRFGAQFAGCPPETIDVLVAYGERIGVAFQLADDLIDLESETGDSGKTPGTDLREGIPTLPVLLARQSTDPADAELLELLSGELQDDARHARALKLLRAHPSLDQAREQTLGWADSARAALQPLPAGPVRDALDALAEGVVSRRG
jgi:geranylgeranyl pyrophosphate synthase